MTITTKTITTKSGAEWHAVSVADVLALLRKALPENVITNVNEDEPFIFVTKSGMVGFAPVAARPVRGAKADKAPVAGNVKPQPGEGDALIRAYATAAASTPAILDTLDPGTRRRVERLLKPAAPAPAPAAAAAPDAERMDRIEGTLATLAQALASLTAAQGAAPAAPVKAAPAKGGPGLNQTRRAA